MKIIHKPDAGNYPTHRCNWGYRNPRNHLDHHSFYELILAMIKRRDQKIICPGCGREVYLEIKIYGHNRTEKGKVMKGHFPPQDFFTEDDF